MNKESKAYQIVRAQQINGSLGISVATRYLKNRGWSCEAAMWILLRRAV
jgi:hypothetical protein